MKVFVNEKTLEVDETTRLFQVRERIKPDADIVVFNGFPAARDQDLHEGDSIQLIRRGIVPGPEEMESLMMSRHTPGVHQALKRSTIGIAGLGGLGSCCAAALCRMGVGRLVIADFDVVEPSNLNRQHYFVDQIGMYKTEATRINLNRMNPYVDVEAHCVTLDESNIPAIFQSATVIVEAFDKADMKSMLIRTVLGSMTEVPVVAASGVAGYGDGNEVLVNQFTPRLFVVGDHKSEARPGNGLMAARVGIAAHQQANTVVRIILGQERTGGS